MLIAAGLLLVPGAGAVAAASNPPDVSLSGDANASPLEIQLIGATVSSHPLIDAQYAHAQSDVASGDQATAHGSVLDPGDLVQTLPYEVGANCPPPPPFPPPPPGSCPQLPHWPFGADADLEHRHVAGSVNASSVGPLSFGAGEYDLQVQPGAASATASGGRATLAPLTVASGSSHASVATAGSSVVAEIGERLQGVVIDGLLDIESIASTVTVRAAAGSRGVPAGHLTVSGVTVAGQPATIDEAGVHLAGQTLPLPLDPAQQALQQLQQAGISVRLLQPQEVASSGYGSYAGSAIQVTLASPQDGSGFSAMLGPAGASAVAVPFQTLLPARLPLGGTTATAGSSTSELPSAAAPAASRSPGSTTSVIRLLGLTLTPRALLLALLALLELSLLAAGVLLFWPARAAPPAPTLRPLG